MNVVVNFLQYHLQKMLTLMRIQFDSMENAWNRTMIPGYFLDDVDWSILDQWPSDLCCSQCWV